MVVVGVMVNFYFRVMVSFVLGLELAQTTTRGRLKTFKRRKFELTVHPRTQ